MLPMTLGFLLTIKTKGMEIFLTRNRTLPKIRKIWKLTPGISFFLKKEQNKVCTLLHLISNCRNSIGLRHKKKGRKLSKGMPQKRSTGVLSSSHRIVLIFRVVFRREFWCHSQLLLYKYRSLFKFLYVQN